MAHKKGETVSVPYGMETRVHARIVSGPHKFTPEQLAENKEHMELGGYSTKRLCKTYYRLKHGRQNMTVQTSSIRPAKASDNDGH